MSLIRVILSCQCDVLVAWVGAEGEEVESRGGVWSNVLFEELGCDGEEDSCQAFCDDGMMLEEG